MNSLKTGTMSTNDVVKSDVVHVESSDGVAVVTMHRPEARNALNGQLREDLRDAIASLDADDSVSAIVLTGSDPAFCAGLDLKELSSDGMQGNGDGSSPLAGVTKPLIGAVNGVAVTGGLELALECDFLIASEHAGFADTHARVGVMPGWGLTVGLPEAIGIRRAREMSFTGNYVDAATAVAWGLVNRVVPHDELLPTARSLAADMASISHPNLAGIKQAYQATRAGVTEAARSAELAYSRAWRFDRSALAANREQIQARGSRRQ